MMKRRLMIIILGLVVIGSFIDALAQRRGARKDEALKFVEAYDRAWNGKDVAVVERLLAPGYVYFTSDGRVLSRQQTLDFLRSPGYILKAAERSEREVYQAGGTVIISSRWKGHGTYEGKEFRDDQRCGLVLVRDGQRWKLLSEHCTQIVSP